LLGGWALGYVVHIPNIIQASSKLSDLNKTLTKQRPEGYLPSGAGDIVVRKGRLCINEAVTRSWFCAGENLSGLVRLP
jgi:hypothetical protein